MLGRAVADELDELLGVVKILQCVGCGQDGVGDRRADARNRGGQLVDFFKASLGNLAKHPLGLLDVPLAKLEAFLESVPDKIEGFDVIFQGVELGLKSGPFFFSLPQERP